MTVAVIWMALFHYYTTISGYVAYLVIFLKKNVVSNVDFFYLNGLALLVTLQIFEKTPKDIIVDLRFYWGWIFFYFIFKNSLINQKTITAVLKTLIILTLLEAVLINTIIHPQLLPNFPSTEASSHFAVAGSYQRPYSFGANATVSSSLLVAIMALCNVRGWLLWLSVLTVLVFASGTGILGLTLLLFVKYRSQMIKMIIPLFAVLLAAYFIFFDEIQFMLDILINKVGLEYIRYMLDFKWLQILDSYHATSVYSLLFGGSTEFRSGDFGFLDYIVGNGFFGLFLFLFFLLTHINKINRLPLLLIIIATFHYPAIFFIPGQVLFGLLLSLNKTNYLKSSHVKYNLRDNRIAT